MNNYLKINGQKIALSDEQIKKIKQSFNICNNVKLSDIPVGKTFKIKEYEFIVLEQQVWGDPSCTAVVLNDLIKEKVTFSVTSEGTNNYDGSNPDNFCKEFETELGNLIGMDKILVHEVDLTADDGLKNYGVVERRVSLMTANERRKYVDILDRYPLKKWEWLATAQSVPPHDNNDWVTCVAPSGDIRTRYAYYFSQQHCGVRPFCILNSNIYVSNNYSSRAGKE